MLRLLTLVLTGALTATLTGTAVAARPVVAAAGGAIALRHPPGSQIADDAVLVLRNGDRLVLVTAAGTRHLAGPLSIRLDPRAMASDAILAVLAPADPARFGSAALMTDAPPGLWSFDIARSDTVCAIDRRAIMLWRGEAAAPLAIALLRRGVPTALAFGAGQALAGLPPAVGADDGDVLTLNGLGAPVTLTLRLLRRPKRLDQLAAAFVRAGCQRQLARLAVLTRLPD